MKRKLGIYGIVFDGESAPTSGKGAVDDLVRDMVDVCAQEGLDVTNPPNKSLSFTTLIKTLQDHGVILRTENTTEGLDLSSVAPGVGDHFLADFQDEVKGISSHLYLH